MIVPINLDAADRMLDEWLDADDQRRFATANWQLIRSNYAAILDAARAGVVAEEPQGAWQWCYVEKWVDDSGVYERVTFDSEDRARRYFRDNVERVEGLNQEFEADDQIIASIEKRRTFEPGEWVPVKQEGTETDG